MNNKQFELALNNIRSSEWELFEELSSRFLSSEFGNLRNMASPSGDGGRDSKFFSSEKNEIVAFQYSVTTNWKTKIKATINRLKETFPETKMLVYMSPKQIGAQGDGIRKECIDQGISLDIRDFSWFSDRLNADDGKFEAASTFVDQIVRPLLEGQKVIEARRPALKEVEKKAALTYLAMQWEDAKTDKGLTKIVYESLVLAVLRGTSLKKTMPRPQIHETILGYLTNHGDETTQFIDAALTRLTKQKIRHHTKEDEFCLTNDEVDRLEANLVDSEELENAFDLEVQRIVRNELGEEPGEEQHSVQDLSTRIIRIIDVFIVKSGEFFASSVASSEISSVDTNLLSNVILEDIDSNRDSVVEIEKIPDIAINVAARVIKSVDPSVRSHLRKISDAYTLFSFLRETPDIQKATKKILGHGNIWLDTSIVLPLLVEAFLLEEEHRVYSSAMEILSSTGVKLYITDGVVQELLNHIRLSVDCSRRQPTEWAGRVPYLYYNYVQNGYAPLTFSSAVEKFRGFQRPEDDIVDYLSHKHSIALHPLSESSHLVDDEVRQAVERLWTQAHEKRRSKLSNGSSSPDSTDLLVQNDVESYLGVIGERKGENSPELGYKNWWLTVDSLAWKIRHKLKDELDNPPHSPLMSLDFLIGSLAFGPSKGQLDRTHEPMLPVLLDVDFSDNLPTDLLLLAETVRVENENLEEYLIRRKVRDACDQLRGKFGPLTKRAIDTEQNHAADHFSATPSAPLQSGG